MTKLAVALFGPDGSGKTTLAYLLKRIFAEVYGRAKIFRMRGMHTLALLVGLLFSKFPSLRGNEVPTLRIRLIHKRIWCLLEVFSLLFILMKLELLRMLYPVIIAERCHIDSAAWLWMYYSKVPLCRFFSSFLLKASVSKFDILVYVTADIDTLLRRRQDERLSKEFLAKQHMLYNALYRILSKLSGAYNTTLCCINTSIMNILESIREIVMCILYAEEKQRKS